VTAELIYRQCRDEDLPGVLRLWAEDSGWGALTPETWRQWYVETPCGAALTMVAVDQAGEVVAQEVFMPVHLVVGEREVRALRVSAPILRKELRRAVLDPTHPALVLVERAMSLAAESDYAVAYALPEPAWLPALRAAPRILPSIPRLAVADYPCVAATLEEPRSAAVDRAGLRVERMRDFGAEYDAFWESARRAFPIRCGVARRAERLRFRHGQHILLEMRGRGGALAGFAVIKVRNALLQDVLARTPADLTDVIGAALTWLAGSDGELAQSGAPQLKAMETPALRAALRALGFEPTGHRFAFAGGALDPTIPTDQIAPDRWYLTPGD
jgi:hypothetical protein